MGTTLLKKNPSSHWVISLIIILVAETLSIVGFTATMPIIPFYIQSEFGITDPNQVKIWNALLNAVPTLMLAITAPIWGALADRTGRKLMLMRAMLGGGISIGLMFFARNIYELFVLRVIQGASTGSIAAANVLMLSIVPTKHAAIALAILQVGIFVGMAVGPFFGGYIFDIVGGKMNFLLSALLLIISAVAILFLIKEPPLEKTETKKKIHIIPDFSILKKAPSLIFLIGATFFVQAAISLVNAQLSLFVAELNVDPKRIGSIIGLVIATAAIAASIGALLFGYLGKKIPLQVCFFTSLIGAAICYFPQAFSPNWEFLLVVHMIDSVFLGGIMPIFNAILNIMSPEKNRGAIFGLSSSVSFMGASLGPFLGSAIAIAFGVIGNRAIFIAGGLMLVCVFLVAIKKKNYWKDFSEQMKNKLANESNPSAETVHTEELNNPTS